MLHPTVILTVVGALTSLDCIQAFAPNSATSSKSKPSSPSLSSRGSTFTTPSLHSQASRPIIHHYKSKSRLFSSRITFADNADYTLDTISATFDPLGCSDGWDDTLPLPNNHPCLNYVDGSTLTSSSKSLSLDPAKGILALSTIVLGQPNESFAATTPLSEGDFNPDSFKPICGASDGFYRFLQGSTRTVVGDEAFKEYGPLIAGGLLRIRLELCVVESFFNEAVGPFIKENGLNWILPFHETVETFLAGTIFALATTFILVGSTKLIQIIAFYGDLVVGGPCRLFGGFFFDRARGQPVTLDVSFFGFFKTRLVGPPVDFKEEELKKALGEKDNVLDFDNVKPADVPLLAVSGGVKVVGDASKLFREFIEGLDLFVGRYLVLIASGYIILKFIHFKVFPDFP
mmetsp:Transcript_28036/g.58451  ORF Transcript_28036/g.58451 Transcript_28036/m.58451 type:complete len:402 (+) Transcript_28036:171-1376(+)